MLGFILQSSGECDLVFLTAPDFGGGLGLDIHVRTKLRYEYTFIESAAVRIGEDIFEIGSWGNYILNGINGATMPNKIADYEITHEAVSDKVERFYIHLSETEFLELKNYKDMVSVKIVSPSPADLGESLGLLGDFSRGQKLARDGQTIIEDINEFGQEWQVLSTDPKLFEATREPRHPTQCRLPGPKAESHRRLGQSIAEETARKACAHWGDAIEQCVYDVMATGDLEYAVAGAMTIREEALHVSTYFSKRESVCQLKELLRHHSLALLHTYIFSLDSDGLSLVFVDRGM